MVPCPVRVWAYHVQPGATAAGVRHPVAPRPRHTCWSRSGHRIPECRDTPQSAPQRAGARGRRCHGLRLRRAGSGWPVSGMSCYQRAMRHGRTATGIGRAYDRDRHVQQCGSECGWSTSEPQSQQRKPNVGGHGRPSASRMAAPLLILPPLHASRRCRRPATIVSKSPTPCSWIWRWSTKSLVRRSIGPEVQGAAWDTRACPAAMATSAPGSMMWSGSPCSWRRFTSLPTWRHIPDHSARYWPYKSANCVPMMCRGLPPIAVGLHTLQREGSLHHEGPWGGSRSRVWRDTLSRFNAPFFGHIFPVLLVSYGRYVFEKICHRLLVGGQLKLRCLLALVSMHVRTLLLLVVYAWFSSPG